MTGALQKGLRVKIRPNGWGVRGSPALDIFDGYRPVLTAYVKVDGRLDCWRTTWGLYGPETHFDVSTETIASLMGWQMPEQIREAA